MLCVHAQTRVWGEEGGQFHCSVSLQCLALIESMHSRILERKHLIGLG